MTQLVSIIIPAYNAAEWIDETIRSCLVQSWSNIEVLAVDDGSTDETCRVVESIADSRVRLVRQRNAGACAARNRGIRESRGDFIQFLDADDLLHPEKIRIQMERLMLEQAGTIASGRWGRFYDHIENASFPDELGYRDFVDPLDWLILAGNTGTMMSPAAWLTPRQIIESAGPWNELLAMNQDGEYFARILLHSSGIAFCADAKSYYRSGLPGSISRQRSADAYDSLFRSIESISTRMLQRSDESEVRRACASYYQRFVYTAYPLVPDLIVEAEERINALGGTNLDIEAGPKFGALINLLGWKRAKWVYHYYLKYRQSGA
jgi:glycosyltransferase involved in cell wall biosynthesis